ncbi:hypothetical protein BH10ACT7_BH10ACT7_09370 [soil metagenome]
MFVSVAYRLGTEGFSVLEGAPLNLGLADVIAAVQWVRDEISAFGGDPEQITLFGQSAGGNLIAAFLAHDGHPAVKRAIIQSAPLTARSTKVAGRITRLVAKDLGVPTTRGAFAAIPPADLIAAQQRVTAGTTPITGGPGFALAIGGDLVPENPETALAQGAADEVELMIGATSEEYRLWFVPSGLLDRISPLLVLAARLKFRIPNRVVAAYRRNHPRANAGTMLGLLATDLLLRLPLNRLADDRLSRGRATWVYDFVWPSPVMGLGAAHAVELGFVFDLVRHPDSLGLAGDSAPQQLADDMHGAWVRFAKTGDPGWEPWTARRPVQTFAAPASAVVYAPREDERSSWRH